MRVPGPASGKKEGEGQSDLLLLLFSQTLSFIYLKKIFFLTFIYFWDRERQSMNGGGAEREGDTESEAGSRL